MLRSLLFDRFSLALCFVYIFEFYSAHKLTLKTSHIVLAIAFAPNTTKSMAEASKATSWMIRKAKQCLAITHTCATTHNAIQIELSVRLTLFFRYSSCCCIESTIANEFVTFHFIQYVKKMIIQLGVCWDYHANDYEHVVTAYVTLRQNLAYLLNIFFVFI